MTHNPTKKDIIQYDSNLEITRTKTQDFAEGAIYAIGDKGDFLDTDEHELWGTTFNLYNQDFELLNTIKPYDGQPFKYSFKTYKEQEAYILVANRTLEIPPKFLTIDLMNGKVLSEINLDSLNITKGGHIQDLIVTNKKIFIPCFKRLISLDKQGNYLWSLDGINAKVTYNPIFQVLSLYDHDKKELVVINENNGKIKSDD